MKNKLSILLIALFSIAVMNIAKAELICPGPDCPPDGNNLIFTTVKKPTLYWDSDYPVLHYAKIDLDSSRCPGTSCLSPKKFYSKKYVYMQQMTKAAENYNQAASAYMRLSRTPNEQAMLQQVQLMDANYNYTVLQLSR